MTCRVGAVVGLALLLASCGDAGETPRRGCTSQHDASGTYRFSHGYLDQRVLLLEESLRIEERDYDREKLAAFVEGMRQAWAQATLVLAPDGTFTLTGVVHPDIEEDWRGTWEVRIDPRECHLVLTGAGEELRALLGEGWVIPWFEKPWPGAVIDLRLDRTNGVR